MCEIEIESAKEWKSAQEREGQQRTSAAKKKVSYRTPFLSQFILLKNRLISRLHKQPQLKRKMYSRLPWCIHHAQAAEIAVGKAHEEHENIRERVVLEDVWRIVVFLNEKKEMRVACEFEDVYLYAHAV